MPYDMIDVYEDIKALTREIIELRNELEEKGIIEKRKKVEKKDTKDTPP